MDLPNVKEAEDNLDELFFDGLFKRSFEVNDSLMFDWIKVKSELERLRKLVNGSDKHPHGN